MAVAKTIESRDSASSQPAHVRPSDARVNFNLIRELAVTSFRLKYTDSLLGYLWSLVKPLLIFGMMYLVFAVFLLRGRTAPGENFPVELLVAVIVWGFFAEATGTSVGAVAGNASLIRKAYFPRWILVIASTLSVAMTFVVNFGLLLVIGLSFGWFIVGWNLLFVPLLMLELYVLIVGMGMFLSALFVSYRDLGHIWEIITQLLFYASAIVYPLSLIPHRFQALAAMNPTTQIIQDLRRALVTTKIPWSPEILGGLFWVPFVIVIAIFAIGYTVFRRLTPRFAENL